VLDKLALPMGYAIRYPDRVLESVNGNNKVRVVAVIVLPKQAVLIVIGKQSNRHGVVNSVVSHNIIS